MATKSSKNEMLIFGLCLTSDDRPSNLSNESLPKMQNNGCQNGNKNELIIFGLRSTSDDQPSNPSDESHLKCEKWPPNHQKMKCSFLDYINF